MRDGKPRARKTVKAVASRVAVSVQPQPKHCKEMFAELSDYLDEKLDDSLCDELEQHLGSCEPCKVFLASLEATISQCRNLRAEQPTAREAVKLRKQMLENYRQAVALVRPEVSASKPLQAPRSSER